MTGSLFDRLNPGLDPLGTPWLEDGERLDRASFHARYLQTPEDFHAQLIGGQVHVTIPLVRARHGRATAAFAGVLGLYEASTPGVAGVSRSTILLGEHDEVEPDAAFYILPEAGGRVTIDDYLNGAPEMVIEIAQSRRSIEYHDKLRTYEVAGVREYLIYNLEERMLEGFVGLVGRFHRWNPDDDGLLRSAAFPGLWLDPRAFAADDLTSVHHAVSRGLDSPEHASFASGLMARLLATGGTVA